MAPLLVTFLVFLAVIGAMAVGVMFGRKPITGSCGGMKALGMNMECDICGGSPERCEARSAPVELARDLAREIPPHS